MASIQGSFAITPFVNARLLKSFFTFGTIALLILLSNAVQAQSESSNAFETYSSEILIGLLVTGLVLVLAVIFVLVERLLRLTEDQVRSEIQEQKEHESGSEEKEKQD